MKMEQTSRWVEIVASVGVGASCNRFVRWTPGLATYNDMRYTCG